MSEPLVLVLGALVSALLTMVVGQLSGLRSDLKDYAGKQSQINERLIKLETEHQTLNCIAEKGMP